MWLLQMALRSEADSMAPATTVAAWVAHGACDYECYTRATFARYYGVGRAHSAEPRRCHPEKGRDSPERASRKEQRRKDCLLCVTAATEELDCET